MKSLPKPVFIFSSSWRSGSTLIQRYITASGEVLVWGENGGALNDLHQAYLGYSQMMGNPRLRYKDGWGAEGSQVLEKFQTANKSERPNLWLASMCPPIEHIRKTLRNALYEIYEKPTIALGYSRFGIKETRCNLATATFLLQLFPDAKFIFLVRDPLDVLLSIKRRNWIGRPAGHSTLKYYAEHWRTRAAEFRSANFGMVLRYEDFTSNSALRNKLIDYLEIHTYPPKDFTKTSRVDWTTRDNSNLTRWERGWVRYWLSDEMKHWGY